VEKEFGGFFGWVQIYRGSVPGRCSKQKHKRRVVNVLVWGGKTAGRALSNGKKWVTECGGTSG